MANIRIEEKKGNSILPWILGLLLIAAIVGLGFAFFDNEDNDEALLDTEELAAPLAEVATEVTGQPDGTYTDVEVDYDAYRPSIAKYMTLTTDMEGEMGLDHEFSHNALTYLADATEAIAGAYSIDITDNTKRAKQLADGITKDPYATNHAEMISMAALNITETLERINERAFANKTSNELVNLRKEAQAINGETLTLNQKEDVRSFFRSARAVLATMK